MTVIAVTFRTVSRRQERKLYEELRILEEAYHRASDAGEVDDFLDELKDLNNFKVDDFLDKRKARSNFKDLRWHLWRERAEAQAEGWLSVLARGSSLKSDEFVDVNMGIFEHSVRQGRYWDAARFLLVETGYAAVGAIGNAVAAVRKTATWAQAHHVAEVAKHWGTLLMLLAALGVRSGNPLLVTSTVILTFVWGLLLALPPLIGNRLSRSPMRKGSRNKQ